VKQQLMEDIEMLLGWLGCEKKGLNVQIDHVHLIVSAPPEVSISKLKEEAILGKSFLVKRLLCRYNRIG